MALEPKQISDYAFYAIWLIGKTEANHLKIGRKNIMNNSMKFYDKCLTKCVIFQKHRKEKKTDAKST